MSFSANSKIIIFTVVVIGAAVLGWYVGNLPASKEDAERLGKSGKAAENLAAGTEQFEIAGTVMSVIPERQSFVMRDAGSDGKEHAVFVEDTTRIIKIQFPFDLANPPKEGSITPTEKQISLDQIKAGDSIFVRSKENFGGKKEIRAVEFIQVLP